MARVELNRQSMDAAVRQAFTTRMREMQSVLDALGASERGKDLSAVKVNLAARWRQQFGATLDEPQLTSWAEHLASGRRLVLTKAPGAM
jgi:hypothetical protein